MDNRSTGAPPPPSSLLSKWPWLGVLLILLLTGFVRYRLLDLPLERDEGEYAYAGQLLLQGIPPYQLAWNMKLPGTYFAYALGMDCFGQTTAGIHETLMVVNALTIIFVFALARRLFGNTAGLAACATFGILSMSPAVMGMAAHANHFVMLFAVWGTLLLWRGEEFYRWYIFFFCGVLYGVAFLMKQQGICFCLFAAVFVIGNALVNKNVLSTVFVRKIFYLLLGMIVPLALTCKYLQMVGVFPKFLFWTYTYAVAYATEVTLHEGVVNFLAYVAKKWLVFFAYMGFILVSVPFMLRDQAYRNKILFASAFLFFSCVATAIGLNFREHYFILLLPALAVFIGLAVVSLRNATENRFFKIIPPLVCLVILGGSVYQQRDFFFQLPANAVSRIIYAGDVPFTAMPAVGDYLRGHSSTGATVAVIGSEPELYFYAQRHSATGYLYMYALMEPQPFASEMQHEMISEIETNQPEFLVFVANPNSWSVRPASDKTVFQWFGHYSSTAYQKQAVLYRNAADVTEVGGTNQPSTNAEEVTIFWRKSSQ